MAGEKVVNYSAEQTAELVAGYKAGETVEALATKLGKTVKSVTAKLVREGVYVAKAKAEGKGTLTKANLVSALASKAGVDAEKLASLEKADKAALMALVAAFVVTDEE